MSVQKKFKVGILGSGVGGIGTSHAGGYCNTPEGFEVIMACDLDPVRAQEIAKMAPNCEVVTDIAKVLSNPEIDIVDICLPPHLHYPIMMQALDAGKHVVCEKPFVSSLKETDAFIKKSEEVGKKVFPVFQYRYGVGFQRFLHLRNNGLLGKAYAGSMETHWRRDAPYYAVDWRGTWAGENGGTIVSHATHIHDLVTEIFGRVEQVSAFLDVRVNPVETEDCAAIAMKTASGALVTSSITLGNSGDMSRIRACFEHVTVESGLQPYTIGNGDWTFTARDSASQQLLDRELDKIQETKVRFDGLMADIYKALIDSPDASPPSTADARHSMELITAIYQADRSKMTQSLPLDSTHPLYAGWQPSK
ncbi:MAG: Gfo/Idh/MocA family oxidoreductase [Oceanospirillaceae bacterium]|nr:Gfo/Idh/MocA family oxidoreductase [Oceanospirillaceae bacterium]